MVLMALPTVVHLTVQAIHTAVGVLVSVTFKLDGRVSNAILLVQHGFQRAENSCTLAWGKISDGGVTGEGVHTAGDAPYMQIMHILDLWHAHHVSYKFGEVDVFGDSFQQDIGGFAQDAPGPYRNEYG